MSKTPRDVVCVKICGITNVEDAFFAVESGADALGFNFYPPSPRFIEPIEARGIIGVMPRHVLTVGVFVNAGGPDAVERIADEAGVDAVQLHGDESPSYCHALSGRRVIKAMRVGDGFSPETISEFEVEAILLDAFSREARGGTGRIFDWDVALRARNYTERLFLAGGLSPANVASAVERVRPYGVDACSSLEYAPGRKDRELVAAFIAGVRNGERRAHAQD